MTSDPRIILPAGMRADAEDRARRAEAAREQRRLEDADLPGVFPEPDERPTPRAQWDEIHGRWLEWDEATDTWIVVGGDDGTAAGRADASGVSGPVEPAEPIEPAWSESPESLDDIE